MARSCGIRIGPRRFELVVLDGTPKKHRIAAYRSGSLLPDPDDPDADPVEAAADALRDAVEESRAPHENVGIAIDTGLAAFRTLKMPFTDPEKIEEVLKYEVEGMLPQWDVENVICDFHLLEETEQASRLLVSAVPKADLASVLALASHAGVEPLEAELETSALVNAAFANGVCGLDAAQILVHVGETSTSVVVVDGGQVREMRAIHIGALSHEPLRPHAPAAEDAAPAPAPADAAEGDAPASTIEDAVERALPDPVETQRRIDQAVKRIRRELGRTVSAARTVHPVQSIYVCGIEMPGLSERPILDVPIEPLSVLQEDDGRPAEGYGQFVVAYGCALRQMGGGLLQPSLRREELRYTGTFEKIELHLALVGLLIVFGLAVWNIFLHKEAAWVEAETAYWRNSAAAYMIGDPKKGRPGYLQYPSEKLLGYTRDLEADELRNAYEQLDHMAFLLREEVRRLQSELGQSGDIVQPQSALTATTLVLDVLASGTGGEFGRPSLRNVEADYQPGRGETRPDSVLVQLDVTFFADNSTLATRHYEAFQRAMREKAWCLQFDTRGSEPLETGEGIYLQGLAITVDVSKATEKELGT